MSEKTLLDLLLAIDEVPLGVLADALRDTGREIEAEWVMTGRPCRACDGSGYRSSESSPTGRWLYDCDDCGGKGSVVPPHSHLIHSWLTEPCGIWSHGGMACTVCNNRGWNVRPPMKEAT